MARITSEGPSQMRVQIIPDIASLDEETFLALIIKMRGDRMQTAAKKTKEKKESAPKEKKEKTVALDLSKLG